MPASATLRPRAGAYGVLGGLLAVLAELGALAGLHELGLRAQRDAWTGWPWDLLALAGFAVVLALATVAWALLFVRVVRARESAERAAALQRALVRTERHFSALARHATDLIVVMRTDTTVLTASPAALAVLGVEADELVGRPFHECVAPPDRLRFLVELDAALDGEARTGDGGPRPAWSGVLQRQSTGTARVVDVEIVIRDLRGDEAVGGVVLTVRDVTEHRRLVETLRHQGFHDGLTGLANRELLLDRLEHALARRERAQSVFVLFLDLDDFKMVNDSLGHEAGDELLRQVARRLNAEVRASDTAARLGGDEFAVLCEELTTVAQARALAGRLHAALGAPLGLAGGVVSLRASIGIAGATESDAGVTGPDLVRNADIAMYSAKRDGRRGPPVTRVYEPGMHTALLDGVELKRDLTVAVDAGQLRLEYQLTVELETGRWHGVEALLRWDHPDRGPVAPLEFIPLAERSGEILAIGRWVVRRACQQAAAWDRSGLAMLQGLSMSVNMSVHQLEDPQVVTDVLAALAEADLDPARLVLEVTESVLLMTAGTGDVVVGRLRDLRAAGVRVAVDDFGTGYSSLGYLQHMPVDVLKMDKTFVDGLSTPEGLALADGILRISEALGLEAVAEGIEQAGQVEALRALRCPVGQGWYYARALDPAALHALAEAGVGADRPRSAIRR